MEKLLVLLFLTYACSDKLDLTYLPPPGSQYSGGRPEDIQIPLEYPKRTYVTSTRPQAITNGPGTLRPDDYNPTIGINREVISKRPDGFVPTGLRKPMNNYQSSINPPSTTTSYAFSQTTTYPPPESYETTLGPITGFPTSSNVNIPTGVFNLDYEQMQNNRNQPSTFNSKQQVSQFERQKPTDIIRRPFSPNQRLDTNYGNPQSSFSTSPSSDTRYPLPQSQNQPTFIDQNEPQHSGISDQSNFKLVPGQISQGPFGPNQIPDQTLHQSFPKRPFVTSPRIPPKGYGSSSLPEVNNSDDFEKYTTRRPTSLRPSATKDSYQPSSELVHNEADTPTDDKLLYRQGQYQVNDKSRIPQNQFKSTTEKISQTLDKNKYPTGNQQRYPESYNDDKISAIYKSRPENMKNYFSNSSSVGYSSNNYFNRTERPQAEFDRAAYIINYDSVITPEGYSYSYDTSNGIHADESGSTIDGTRAKGSYSYTGDDGKIYSVIYTADENGFRPYGDHLPTPPPIPEAIQRIIDKVKEEKEAGIIDDGSYSEDKYGHRQYQGIPAQNSKSIYYIGKNVVDENKENSPSSDEQSENQQQRLIDESTYDNEKNMESDKARKPYSESSSRLRNRYPGTENDDTNIGNNQIPKIRPFDGAAIRRPNIKIESNKFVQSPLDDITNINRQNQPYNNRYPYSEYNNQRENSESLPVMTDKTLQKDKFYENTDEQYRTEKEGTNFGDEMDENKYSTRPFAATDDINKSYFDGKSRNGNNFSTQRPFSQSTDNISDDRRNYSDLARTTVPIEEYTSYYGAEKDSDTNQTPVRGKQPTSTYTSNDQIETKTRRPYGSRLKVNEKGDLIEDEMKIDEYGTSPKYQIPKTGYDKPDKEVFEGGQENIRSMKPVIFTTKYADDQYRPGLDQTYPGMDNANDDSGYNSQITTPSSNRGYKQQKINKTGYQYIPPRFMFYDEEDKKRVPVNRPMMPSRGRPSQQTKYFDNVPNRQPLVTPNYPQNTGKPSGDNYYEEEGSFYNGRPFDQNQYKVKPVAESYNINDPTQLSPDHKQQQSPEYGIRKDTLNPNQSNTDSYTTDRKYGEKESFNRVSPTLKPSPTPAYYDTTQKKVITPEVNLSGQARPEYDISSSSTPFPIPDYDDMLNKSRLPTKSQAGDLSGRVTKYHVPSTTLKPNYNILRNNTFSIPSRTVVDMYGRPIPTETSPEYENEYTDISSAAPSFKNKNKEFDRPTSDGPRGFSSENMRADNPQLQVTTDKIKGEDFSGPKQPQRFDPKIGYYYK